MASSPTTLRQIEGEKVEAVADFIFLSSKITVDSDCRYEIKTLVPWKGSYDKPRQHIEKQRHYFANKGPYSKNYGISSSHVQIWELDHKKGWALKNWCFWIVVLEKTLESPLDHKEIKPVNPKEINLEYSLEGLMLKLKPQYFGHLMWRVDSLEKTLLWERLKAEEEKGGRGWN